MTKTIIRLLALLIAAFLVYFLLIRNPGQKQGKKAPDFTAEKIDGSAFRLSELKGNYVLLDFWGSWCAPCRRDNPSIVALYEKYNGQNFKDAEGFEVVTVALEKNDRTWRAAAEKDGFSWPYQIVQQSKAVMLSPVAQKYAVKNIPAKFLIDPEGQIIGVNQKASVIEAFLSSKTEDS